MSNKTRKYVVIITLLILVSLAFLPYPFATYHSGVYNNWSGLIWCITLRSCTHEVAHKMDDMNGWVSKTDEFIAVADRIGWTHGNSYPEKYANIFRYAKGKKENMPEVLREFYDWELAERLLARY